MKEVASMIKRPLYTDKIMAYIGTPFVKILTGVRRCGKSTILKMLMDALRGSGIGEKSILHYNFDSLKYEDLKTAKALFAELQHRLSPDGMTYVFLDEIQEVDDWEKVVNSLMSDFDVDIYVTGSNSRMMSSEISTYLTGRYIQFRVFPLSFDEYLTFRRHYREGHGLSYGGVIEEIDGTGYGGGIDDLNYYELTRYLRYGGFPAIHRQEYPADAAYTIVRDIYNSTIFTDIVKRNEIRKVDQLERIVRFVFDNVGRTFSAASITKYLKSQNRTIDNETVYSYLEKLENAYIIHRCSRYDVQGKEILKTQEKFYLADPAFRYSVLGYSSDSVAAMLENIVYLELRRRGYDVFVGKLNKAEIDFIATKQENKLYVQVTQEIASAETERREYGRLLDIHDNYPKYVLRTDAFAGGNYKGIKTMHVADFLLNEDY
jgi:predicted AAA+ superfamily ATPase